MKKAYKPKIVLGKRTLRKGPTNSAMKKVLDPRVKEAHATGIKKKGLTPKAKRIKAISKNLGS